ncbi:MAG: RloB family protein [Acidiferrobacter sp.]
MARISRSRGNRSFRRLPGQKLPRSITLIVCEGETEQVYFEAARIHYRLTTAEIILAENTEGSAPISVVDCAEKRSRELGGYDQIYCVFDQDDHESFARARDKIQALANRQKKPLPIAEAISIPCFEVWVLLHFEKTDAAFDCCADVIARVRRYVSNYEKANAAIAELLVANVNHAIGNAQWLVDRAVVNAFNPYTSIHRVLQHFASVVGQSIL